MSKHNSGPERFMSSASKHEYSEIKAVDEEDANFLGALPLNPRPRPKSRLRAVLSLSIKSIVVALAVYGAVDLGIYAASRIRSSHSHWSSSSSSSSPSPSSSSSSSDSHASSSSSSSSSAKPCHCGNSIAEAIAMGCKYDSLATSWLPDHCRDDEMTQLFEQSGPGPNGEWDYYASHTDLNRTYTLHEIAQLADLPRKEDREVWATTSWHDKHCFFTLLKQVRGKAKLQYTGFEDGVHHAEHCAMQMAERHPADMVIVSTSPGFGDPEEKEIEELNRLEEAKMKEMMEKKKKKQEKQKQQQEKQKQQQE